MKSIKLLEDEKEIENEIEELRPVTATKKKTIETILTQARKNKSIRLRISNFDLEKLKEKADITALPIKS